MLKQVYGKKVGMTQIISPEGQAIPITVVYVDPCKVIQKKSVETDGYNAIKIAFGDVKEKHTNKPDKGQFDKANTTIRKYMREVKVDDANAYNIGDELKVDVFAEGDKIDVQSISKGKGFEGTIKRHNGHRGPMSHGSMYHRRPGSMGAHTDPGRVFKNKKLPGHMGVKITTVKNLKVVRVDLDRNIILIRGSIPGAKGAVVRVRQTTKVVK